MIGFHLQNSPNGWPSAVAKLPDNAITKLLFGVERARESKEANPNVKTWYRWVGDQPLPHDNFEQHCRDWLNQFIDGTFRREARHVDYIQGYNETLANSQPTEERARWIQLHTAMAKVWHDEYRQEDALSHIRIILCETAIGNDVPYQIAAAAERYDAILGWHPYVSCRVGKIVTKARRLSFMPVSYTAPRAKFRGGGLYKMHESVDSSATALRMADVFKDMNVHRPAFVSPHDWQWYSGRWATMDAEYKARGITVDWAFGEGGPVLDASEDWSGWLDPLGGWKNPDCLGGDLNKYKQVLTYWLENATQTPAYKEGRLLGLQLFTSGAPSGSGGQWSNFDLVGDDMQQIAEFSEFASVYVYPPPGDKPQPPKPPDPPALECRGAPREQYAREYLVVPQDTSLPDWLDVCQVAYANKQTIGFSYDDAGIGDLDKKNAVLYGVDDDKRGTMAEWFFTHYPTTTIEFVPFPQHNLPEPSQGVIIDVSHWQGEIDWQAASANGVIHAYIKATEGDNFTDSAFNRNWDEAGAYGIQRGAYHYYRNHVAPADQAAHFMRVLDGRVGELPPAMDVEDTETDPEASALHAWLLLVQDAANVRPVVYTGAWYWDNYFPSYVEWANDYKLWVASYRAGEPVIPEDWDTWWLWQYTSTGNGATYGAKSVHIDMNRFNRPPGIIA